MATILVIDDDPTALILAEHILESAGHEAMTSSDPTRVPGLAAARGVDAVILDILMPGRSGDVLRGLRDEPRTGGVPILFLSSLSSSEDRIRGLREGADDFLTKPFAPEELKLRVERLVAQPLAAPSRLSACDLERSLTGGKIAGQVYLGRYRALEVVGEGSAGLVICGWDPHLKRPVALKTRPTAQRE